MLEILLGIIPEADPAVLHELLRRVDCLQFTGSSAMFRGLGSKAYDLGNFGLQHAGEVCGLNLVRFRRSVHSDASVANCARAVRTQKSGETY